MTTFGVCLAGAVLCAGAAWQNVPTREVIVSVIDRDGKPVTNLRPDEFTVRVDDEPVPVVSAARSDLPLSMTVVLDMSLSSRLWPQPNLGDPARSVVDAILKETTNADTARLARVGGVALFVSPPLSLTQQPFTIRIRNARDCPGNGSPIWDAVGAAVHALVSDPHRRLVVLVTDGKTTEAELSVAHASHYAVRMKTAVSVIDVGRSETIRQWNGESAIFDPAKALRWLAGTTGGAYIPDDPALGAPRPDPYPGVRRAIAIRRHAYSVAYRLPASTINAVSVTVSRPRAIVLVPAALDTPPVELSASLLSRVRDFEVCK